jgi:hypothetical protein
MLQELVGHAARAGDGEQRAPGPQVHARRHERSEYRELFQSAGVATVRADK